MSERTPREHALVVGGTGMLRSLCLALAARGQAVSVIAQARARLAALADEAAAAGGVIHPLPVDYGHEGELHLSLDRAIARHGPISLAVCWIHDDAPLALPLIARRLSEQAAPGAALGEQPSPAARARVFHLVGSAAADPSVADVTSRVSTDFPGLEWRRVVLGFKISGKQSRWLTHDEIWRGVLQAIDHDWKESILGTVTPWKSRPGT